MKRLGLIALALLLPSLAGAKEVAPLKWGARLGFGPTVVTDRGLDLVANHDWLFSSELLFSLAPFSKLPGLDLELGGSGLSASETAFQTYTAELSTTSLLVGARYRRSLFSWLNVYGRLGATLDWNTLTLTEKANTTVLSDTAFTAGVQGAAGTEWLIHLRNDDRQPTVAFGLYFEVGYVQRFTQAKFDDLRPEGATRTDPERIAFTPVNVGSMSLSAPYWRLGGLLRF